MPAMGMPISRKYGEALIRLAMKKPKNMNSSVILKKIFPWLYRQYPGVPPAMCDVLILTIPNI
jgi:hypothetical protein